MTESKTPRGSELLLNAWKNRHVSLTDQFVKDLGDILADSPAKLQTARFSADAAAKGASFSLSYAGDDIPRCGNDLRKLHKLAGNYGVTGPIVIINGIPALDQMHVEVQFGIGG